MAMNVVGNVPEKRLRRLDPLIVPVVLREEAAVPLATCWDPYRLAQGENDRHKSEECLPTVRRLREGGISRRSQWRRKVCKNGYSFYV
jgi:hypothetical protein